MTRHRSWLSLSATALWVSFSLIGCPDIPERAATWADEDTWVDLQNGDATDGADGVAALSLGRIFASTDKATGGARVTITGTGFEQGMTVTFGEVEGSYVLAIDDTRLNVDVPPHDPGLVDVTVTRLDGMSATLEEAFLYQSPIELSAIDVTEGLITGGGVMTVTGAHFDEETRILVGRRQLINATLVDPQTIVGQIPGRHPPTRDR